MLPIERLAGPTAARGHEPPRLPDRRRRRRRRPHHRLRPAARRRGRRGQGAAATNVVTPFEGYIRIAPDNTVTVLSAHIEMGQGTYTGIATLVAEELDADWSQMRAEGACGQPQALRQPRLGRRVQGTGGSTAHGELLRCATARPGRSRARCWSRPPPSSGACRPSEITVEKGVLSAPVRQARDLRRARRRRGPWRQQLAAMQPADDIPLKDPGLFKLIGNDEPAPARHGGEDHRAAGLHDRRPPARHADRGRRPPAALRRQGARASTRPRPSRSRAWSTWSRSRAGSRSCPDHLGGDQGPRGAQGRLGRERAERRGSEDLMADYRTSSPAADAAVARNDGDVEQALKAGGQDARGRVRVPLPRPRGDGAAQRGRVACRTTCSRSGPGTRCPTSTRRSRPRSRARRRTRSSCT